MYVFEAEEQDEKAPIQRPSFMPGELKLHLKSVIFNGSNVESISVKFVIQDGEEHAEWNSSTQEIINNKAEWTNECVIIHLDNPSGEIVVEITNETGR